MEISDSISDFANWIAAIIRCDLSESDDEFTFIPKGSMSDSIQLTLNKAKLQSEIDKLANYDVVSETVIANSRSYEILVREEGQYFRFSPRSQGDGTVLELEDSENKLNYTLGRPSNQFTLYLIKTAATFGDPKALTRNIFTSSMFKRAIDERPCVLEFVKKFISGRMTLLVTSNVKKSLNEFDKFSTALLFNISYNTDSALVQQRDFEELLRTGRITRTRSSNINELDPPRRTYVPDLIHHYQLAVGTENPMLEYISYYHIAEHFFESIFNEALIEKVKNKLTHPDFSYKRKKDISSLIKDIGNSIKMRDESMTFSEQEGLRLTLKKHVNVSELIQKLNDYDGNLVNYYKTNQVSFSGAGTVNLEGEDDELIFKHLAVRIYRNRNSIVHSKESEKSKYTPFRDDRTLVKEVPLLRFVSEQIIFATSTLA